MIVPEKVRWADPRIVRIEGGGTGTIIDVDGKPYVAMFAHGHAEQSAGSNWATIHRAGVQRQALHCHGCRR